MDAVLPLYVAVPLVASALALLSPRRAVRDGLHIGVPAAGVLAAGWLYAACADGPLAHNVGLFEGGVAIPFLADRFSALMMIATSLVASVSNWFATVAGETRARLYASLSLMLVTGVNGALLTADLFNFFVFIEVMLLPSYGLIAMTGTWSRLAGGRMFILVNLTASTMLVIGVGLLYGVTGTVNIAALRGAGSHPGPAMAALGLVVLAIAVKAGVFPVHTWLPRSYPGTSAAVMGLFSGLHTKVAVYMLYRLFAVVFAFDSRWDGLMIAVLTVSMLVGAFGGLGENSIRRVLAYQMVNGMPFILVMLVFAGDAPRLALAGGILYAVHHMVTIGALTLASGAVEETYGTALLRKLHGLARREPLLAWIFAAGSFSVVGLPPFSGLWGKVAVVIGAAHGGDHRSWTVIGAIIVASMAALLTMLRVWRNCFWGKPMQRYPKELRIRRRLLAPAASLMLISFGMFLAAGPVLDAVRGAAGALEDTGAYATAVLGEQPVGVWEGGR